MLGYLIGWIVFGCVVLGLAIYRKTLTRHEEDWVHLAAGEERQVSEQVEITHRLAIIDRWGIWLTVALVLYGAILATIFIKHAWEAQKTMGM